ncbi:MULTISPECIES: DNA cytosine methyltransferase [Metallosphaera]|uniref:DNA cytosine methyltransferase n=1 Tax=Metallosphaera TaxID=41980 RepID=UPI001F06AADC|nr:DNA cytosine methyltransferase [Metallosphaera sedula]MCH1771775.1 DNA cytosine methyltransferase [Metallosphaera sedula]MCP6729943.1 DNA cytosine methyltransferase [Metallosphaera sedula]
MGAPKVVDLFSGAGGFGRGFKEVGFQIGVAVEINHAAARTYSANFPTTVVLEEDIREITGREIVREIGKEPDVVIGSPPCEPFTAANPLRLDNPVDRLYQDERGALTLEFIRLVGELRPKFFVMENVPSIVETRELREALIHEFRKVGYEPVFNLLRAEDYGNPSRRTRIFISNLKLELNTVPKRTVWDAISDLENRFDVPNHEIVEVNERKLREMASLDYGDYLTMFRGHNKEIPLYVRLDPMDIAPTVMGNSKFVHPFSPRYLTVREQARLMSYPDYHVFYGSKEEQYNQVGEAVPVVLSRGIASSILGAL